MASHGVAGILGADAINHVINGNYQIAALESIASAGIEILKYYEGKEQRIRPFLQGPGCNASYSKFC
jgi:hypothetical protein